jgi:hypothetical protein
MKRQDYFPTRRADQPAWLMNFARKLAVYAPQLDLPPETVAAAVADALAFAHALGVWINGVRRFAESCSASLETLATGECQELFILPTYTAADVPEGVGPVLPGAQTRLFKMVQIIKFSPGYTPSMGIDMGIVTPPTPAVGSQRIVLDATVLPGPDGQRVSLAFLKYGHDGASVQSQRGGGAWEDLGICTRSPFMDERPLLIPGVPETRNYRACYWHKGQSTGDWSDVVSVTVGV